MSYGLVLSVLNLDCSLSRKLQDPHLGLPKTLPPTGRDPQIFPTVAPRRAGGRARCCPLCLCHLGFM